MNSGTLFLIDTWALFFSIAIVFSIPVIILYFLKVHTDNKNIKNVDKLYSNVKFIWKWLFFALYVIICFDIIMFISPFTPEIIYEYNMGKYSMDDAIGISYLIPIPMMHIAHKFWRSISIYYKMVEGND